MKWGHFLWFPIESVLEGPVHYLYMTQSNSRNLSLYLPIQRLVETFNLHCYDNVDIVKRNEQEREVQ